MKMIVTYSLIENGRIVGQQEREYDNHNSAILKAIERDSLDGMDIGEQCRSGRPVQWIEARLG
jgi:hypothetical protein